MRNPPLERDIVGKVREALESCPVVFLLGPRRCGRSICLQQIARIQHAQYIQFQHLDWHESMDVVSEVCREIQGGVEKPAIYSTISRLHIDQSMS